MGPRAGCGRAGRPRRPRRAPAAGVRTCATSSRKDRPFRCQSLPTKPSRSGCSASGAVAGSWGSGSAPRRGSHRARRRAPSVAGCHSPRRPSGRRRSRSRRRERGALVGRLLMLQSVPDHRLRHPGCGTVVEEDLAQRGVDVVADRSGICASGGSRGKWLTISDLPCRWVLSVETAQEPGSNIESRRSHSRSPAGAHSREPMPPQTMMVANAGPGARSPGAGRRAGRRREYCSRSRASSASPTPARTRSGDSSAIADHARSSRYQSAAQRSAV